MVTHLYAECSSRNVRQAERYLIFVVDYEEDDKQVTDRTGEPVVYKGKGHRNCTYTEGILIALAWATLKVPMEGDIHIHTSNAFVVNMISTQLEEWRQRDFCRSDGSPIKAQGAWRQIAKALEGRETEASAEKHAYYNWMLDRMNGWKDPQENGKPA